MIAPPQWYIRGAGHRLGGMKFIIYYGTQPPTIDTSFTNEAEPMIGKELTFVQVLEYKAQMSNNLRFRVHNGLQHDVDGTFTHAVERTWAQHKYDERYLSFKSFFKHFF